MRAALVVITCLVALLVVRPPEPALAQAWGPTGVSVCSALGQQDTPAVTSDGQGGAFVVWMDYQSGGSFDIYAQHLTAAGSVAAGWLSNGNPVCTTAAEEVRPVLCPDGAGGAFVAWTGSGVNVQRLSANGALLPGWPFCGVAVAAGIEVAIVPDGVGGVFVAYTTPTGPSGWDIRAQRLTGAGAVAPGWPAAGIAVCTASGDQSLDANSPRNRPHLIADGAGGFIVAWWDKRASPWRTYAQRVSGSGTPQWTANGVPVSSASYTSIGSTVCSDASGGAFVASRDAVTHDIRLVRIRSSGAVEPAQPICTIPNITKSFPALVPDGAGGAIITWSDCRNATNNCTDGAWRHSDVFAQRVDSTLALMWPGNPSWPNDGIFVADGGDGYTLVCDALPDGSGGALLVWGDPFDWPRGGSQHLAGSGAPAPGWPVNGSPHPGRPEGVASDGADGAILAYSAYEVDKNIRAYRISPTTVSVDERAAPEPFGLVAAPNPSSGRTSISFVLPAPDRVNLLICDAAGRAVRRLLSGPVSAGAHMLVWDGRDAVGAKAAPGVYFVRLVSSSGLVSSRLVSLVR